MKKIESLCFAIVGTLLLNAQANALTIEDVYPTDDNIITNTTVNPGTPPNFIIVEDYNEKYKIRYPSHDGWGIVNQQGNFFDKIVRWDAVDVGAWKFDFVVTNTTPWSWSDYHFEFWDETFSTRLSNFPLNGWSNNIFLNSAFDGSMLSFWAPNWQAPGVTNDFSLLLNLDNTSGSLGIRQVATVPEPTTFAMFGMAISGFRMLKRRKRVAGDVA